MQKGSIVVVKTLAGEEVIGRLASDYVSENETVSLKQAFAVMFTPNQTIGLVPFMMSADDGSVVEIRKTALAVYPRTASKRFEDGYLQQTSSIQLVKP